MTDSGTREAGQSSVVASTLRRKRSFVPTALALLREYTEKLDSLADRVQELALRTADDCSERQKQIQRQQKDILEHRIDRLAVATEGLVRRISQLVEHGNVDEDSRLELRLRLAELEAAREAALDSQLLVIAD
jgi:hypothetical protein